MTNTILLYLYNIIASFITWQASIVDILIESLASSIGVSSTLPDGVVRFVTSAFSLVAIIMPWAVAAYCISMLIIHRLLSWALMWIIKLIKLLLPLIVLVLRLLPFLSFLAG